MTRLWTVESIAKDDNLHAELSDLAAAISPLFSNRSVVFHRRGGRHSPAVSDGSFHVMIDCSPTSASARRKFERERESGLRPPEGSMYSRLSTRHRFGTHTLIRNASCRLEELETVTDESSTPIAQFSEHTLFLLLVPHDNDMLIDILARVLFYRFFGLSRGRRLAEATSVQELDAVAVEIPALSGLVRILRGKVRERLLRTIPTIGRANAALHALDSNCRNLGHEKARILENLEQQKASLAAIRTRRRADRVFDRMNSLRHRMKEQIEAILSLPQVIGVRSHRNSGRNGLAVRFAPMSLGDHMAGGERDNVVTTRFIQGVTIFFPVGESRPRPLMIDDRQSEVIHPHRRYEFCLGNVEERICGLLSEGSIFLAVQMMIGYLQDYNKDDSWGQSGIYWPCFSGVEIMPGNRIRLPAAEETGTVSEEIREMAMAASVAGSQTERSFEA
jgi:hypothetical protein